MRYIPNLAGNVVVQVPEDKNSYVNVLSLGATGKGDIQFSGRVIDIQNNLVTIDNIQDNLGGTISQYRDTLKSPTDLTVFTYRLANTTDLPILSVTSHTSIGVNFSSSSSTNSNLAPLTYYVFGFDPVEGLLPNFRSTVNVGTKVLNPTLWSTAQYVQLSFTRTRQRALPLIYRVWGNKVEFLGVIGANKAGYPNSSSVIFRDLGLTEIPSWFNDPVLPWYLSDLFSIEGSEVRLIRKMTSKLFVTIEPNQFTSQTSYIQGRTTNPITNSSSGDTARFVIDDTKVIKNAVDLCAESSVKEVFFPAGVYNVTDTNFLTNSQKNYSNISLRGVGSASLIKRLPCTLSNSSYPGLLNFTGQPVSPRLNGIKIRNLQFDGSSSETFSSVSPITNELGIRIQYADSVVIDECSVKNCGGGGIGIYNTKGVNLTSNSIQVSGRQYEQPVSPLIIDTGENVVAQGNLMEFATTGPTVISTEFSVINGNIIRACGDRGIDIQSSSQWNVQSNNVAYSDNDSLIRSIDTYNNEYSRATIEVRKGIALDPIYMTVTYGGESVSIVKNSVKAYIYLLNSEKVKISPSQYAFRVLETSAQLEAGIFSITLPGTTSITANVDKPIPSTSSLNNENGYMYEVTATVLIGNGGRGYQPLSLVRDGNYVKIFMRNPSDILSFQIFSSSSPENDRIRINGFGNTGLAWDPSQSYIVEDIDTDTNSILISINTYPTLAAISNSPVEFTGSPRLVIFRSNYFVADGNLYVHSS